MRYLILSMIWYQYKHSAKITSYVWILCVKNTMKSMCAVSCAIPSDVQAVHQAISVQVWWKRCVRKYNNCNISKLPMYNLWTRTKIMKMFCAWNWFCGNYVCFELKISKPWVLWIFLAYKLLAMNAVLAKKSRNSMIYCCMYVYDWLAIIMLSWCHNERKILCFIVKRGNVRTTHTDSCRWKRWIQWSDVSSPPLWKRCPNQSQSCVK